MTRVIARRIAWLGVQAATKQSHEIHFYSCIFKAQLILNQLWFAHKRKTSNFIVVFK